MKKLKYYIFASALILIIICGPAATWLQSRDQWASPQDKWDAIYLVCGARVQNKRIEALDNWMHQNTEFSVQHLPLILIGSDQQKSLWCRKHQTNHTVTEWAVEKIYDLRSTIYDCSPSTSSTASKQSFGVGNNQQISLPINPPTINHQLLIVPGEFSNTDGEMQALACYLKSNPQIRSIALVTSRYHARRAQQRLREHIDITIGIIPGIKRFNNHNPITVSLEYLKIIRDKLGLSHTPIISRPKI